MGNLLSEKVKSDKWKFSPINNIEEAIFNQTLERFYTMGVNGPYLVITTGSLLVLGGLIYFKWYVANTFI
mgnify:CR=1 FL=1